MQKDLLDQLPTRQGHFQLESGHHGNLWLDLDVLLLQPTQLRPLIKALAGRLARYDIEAVCGPLIGGAFVAQMVAEELDKEFFYVERMIAPFNYRHYAVNYQIPQALQNRISKKATAIVDDAINAGSALRATLASVEACGARAVAIGALVLCGETMATFASEHQIPLESLA